MKKNIAFSSLLALLLTASSMHAQSPSSDNIYMLDMSGILPYILVFYVFTFLGLGLFITKLLRPNFSNRWLYISCTIAILGAGIVTWVFKDIKNTQLPGIENSDMKVEDLSEEAKHQLQQRQREDSQQDFADFWIISIPNIVLLGLGIFYDWRNRGRDPNAVRGRYD